LGVQPERATRPPGESFAWRLRPNAGSITDARHAFQSWLAGSAVPGDDVADLAVVLSELAANAIAGSAAGPDRGEADIRAGLDDGAVWLEVTNTVGSEDDGVLRWDLSDPLRGGGRGLMIVRAYTDAMEVDSVHGRVTVRCTRSLRRRA
jgi:anti-sigma regulatory factor (Ser/Thr protein kinase)